MLKKIFLVSIGIFFLGGCAWQKPIEPQPVAAPVTPAAPEKPQDKGYVRGLIQIEKDAHQNVQNATDAENKRLQDALK
jgi:hypothetical protein